MSKFCSFDALIDHYSVRIIPLSKDGSLSLTELLENIGSQPVIKNEALMVCLPIDNTLILWSAEWTKQEYEEFCNDVNEIFEIRPEPYAPTGSMRVVLVKNADFVQLRLSL